MKYKLATLALLSSVLLAACGSKAPEPSAGSAAPTAGQRGTATSHPEPQQPTDEEGEGEAAQEEPKAPSEPIQMIDSLEPEAVEQEPPSEEDQALAPTETTEKSDVVESIVAKGSISDCDGLETQRLVDKCRTELEARSQVSPTVVDPDEGVEEPAAYDPSKESQSIQNGDPDGP